MKIVALLAAPGLLSGMSGPTDVAPATQAARRDARDMRHCRVIALRTDDNDIRLEDSRINPASGSLPEAVAKRIRSQVSPIVSSKFSEEEGRENQMRCAGAFGPLLAVPAAAQERPDPARLRASVEKLVSFGTRHTLSDPANPARGIGAARRWFAAELARLGDQCGCIEVANIARTFTGDRAPAGVEVVDVLGFQAGSDPRRIVIVMGHIDSRVTDVMDATADAPGANDDGSGVALVLEAARILSKQKFDATIVYAATSGEEQGLFGGQLLADTARERGWQVTAVLNNDIVGNSIGTGGARVAGRVRVFSEGLSAADPLGAQLARRADGGEDDGPSRALAKAIDGVAAAIPGGLEVMAVRRPDRFGRSGDHSPFQKLGFPAVRFTVGIENYNAQHQALRPGYGDTPDKMDFDYLAKVTAINVATIRRLAAAPAAPEKVVIGGALSADTSVRWTAVPGAAGYRIHWRRADMRDWTNHRDMPSGATEAVLEGVVVDDDFVGVSALAADGSESLVTFGGRR